MVASTAAVEAVPFPLAELVSVAIAAVGRPDWSVRVADQWCRVGPPEWPKRLQGWKIHVSATPLSAPQVLFAAAVVLARHECVFTFANGMDRVRELTAKEFSREQAGKFITAYPADDNRFRDLVEDLDRATAGLPGPRILSDRPYRSGSLVHYRYGAFTGVTVLTNDGQFDTRILDPQQVPVADSCRPWFSPPDWAVAPLPAPTPRNGTSSVVLADRYEVRTAIAHSVRGGVYRALDRTTGAEVIVKQARPHVDNRITGEDGRDALRAEWALLAQLEGIGPTPVELFERDEHVFLVEHAVPGRSLENWVATRIRRAGGSQWRLPVADALAMADRLAALLAEIHQRGLVYRDFTPANIMVGADDSLTLIDPELAVRSGPWVQRGYSPGFAAPEVLDSAEFGPAPEPASDLFSLGATLFCLVTGMSPALAPDDGHGSAARSARERLARVLRSVAVQDLASQRVAPAILGLTEADPARRWSVARVRAFLADPVTRMFPVAGSAELADSGVDRLIEDGLAHIVATMRPTEANLWDAGATGDPCAVQHGAAGVLAVLTRASALFDTEELRSAVRCAAGWIDQRLTDVPVVLPGLYFGRSGTALVLYEAARYLGDEAMAGRALAFARRIPVHWPNPDVSHGAAGAGLAQLRLWQLTGDVEFLDRANDCADGLLIAAEHTEDGVFWPVPTDFDSELAGRWHYGFGHGVAGVGAFLTAVGVATGRADCLGAAGLAAETLLHAAVLDHDLGGARWWTDRNDEREGMGYHRCGGSSGVGTFLLRFAGTDAAGPATVRLLAMVRQAAIAVRRTRWTASPAACHGLAGNGDFLLDLAAVAGTPYRDWARELAQCMAATHTVRNGRMLVVDETRTGVTVTYRTGLAGAIGFLVRLRHGGPACWL